MLMGAFAPSDSTLIGGAVMRFGFKFDIAFDAVGDVRDGNELFDKIVPTSSVPCIVRKQDDIIWCKVYSPVYELQSEDPRDHPGEDPETMLVPQSIYKNYEEKEVYMRNMLRKFDLDKIEICDVVAVTVKFGAEWKPGIPLQKGEEVNTIFRFDQYDSTSRSKVFIKNLSHSTKSNLKWKPEDILRALDIDAKVEKEIATNIRVRIQVDKRIISHVLLDLIMLDPNLRKIFSYRDSTFLLENSDKNYKLTCRTTVLQFEVSSKVRITNIISSPIEDEQSLDIIRSDIDFLLAKYDNEAEVVMDFYDRSIPSGISLKLTSNHEEPMEDRATLEHLRSSVPELFVSGYSRECAHKPFMVDLDQARELNAQGRETLVYPSPDGPQKEYSRIYACKAGFHPGLKRNRLSNRDEFEFIPVCYSRGRKQSQETEGSKMYTKTNFPLAEGHLGKTPRLIEYIFSKQQGPMTVRRGVPKGPFSFLDCVENKVKSEKLSEILFLKSSLEGRTDFMSPIIYRDAVEKACECDIYIFEMTKDGTSMCVEEEETWQRKYKDAIGIILFKNVLPFHCEILEELDADRLASYKYRIISIINRKRIEQGPLINIIEDDEDPSYLANFAKQREITYFIHDLIRILGKLHPRGTKAILSEVIKTSDQKDISGLSPHFMRQRFSSFEEAIQFYAKTYPMLFDENYVSTGVGVNITLSSRMIDRFCRCTFRKFLFPLLQEEKHFTQMENTFFLFFSFFSIN
jgi:hypothetical protein